MKGETSLMEEEANKYLHKERRATVAETMAAQGNFAHDRDRVRENSKEVARVLCIQFVANIINL